MVSNNKTKVIDQTRHRVVRIYKETDNKIEAIQVMLEKRYGIPVSKAAATNKAVSIAHKFMLENDLVNADYVSESRNLGAVV